jgi:ketosteroid isomerase-like protein
MTSTTNTQADLEILEKLNAAYLASDQNSDVKCYETFLAEDFTASLPDYSLRDRTQFLEMIARPRPFTDLTMHDVRIRLLGDFAIVHAAFTYKSLDGMPHEGRYTDDYARRNGKWLCVAASVITESV